MLTLVRSEVVVPLETLDRTRDSCYLCYFRRNLSVEDGRGFPPEALKLMDKSKLEPEKMELVGVTHVVDAITFWAQNVNEDQAVEKMTNMLSEKCPVARRLMSNPSPQKIYAALFSEDGCWYRCKVLQQTEDKLEVSYMDYGNTEVISRSALVELSEGLQTASLAKKYRFWGFHVSSDQDSAHFLQGKTFLQNLIFGKKLRIQKKSVCFDGTILVQAFQGNLDIGEEVLKMKFAKLSLPENSPQPSRVLQDPSALWPHRVLERGDLEMSPSLGSMPKLRPAFTDQKPQAHKEKATTTPLQPANLLKKKMDQELMEENERLKAERGTQQQGALLLERELRDTRAELQRANLAVLKETKEVEKLKAGNGVLQQKMDILQNQLKETRLALELAQQEKQKNAGEVEKLLETAAGDKLGKLAEKVDLVRNVRKHSSSSTVGDSLLQAITIVMNNRLSIPVAMEKLEVAWKEYSHAQEMVKACQMRKELVDLIDHRNKVRCALVTAVDDYIQEVDGLPISERMDMLEHVAVSLTAVFGPFLADDAGERAFHQFSEWKSRKQQESQSVRERTDTALQSLCSWFSDAGKFFCLSSKTSVCLSDVFVGLDALLKRAELDLFKELEVSQTEQKDQDVQIVSGAFNKVIQEIQREQSLLCNIREKYLQNLQFKEELHQWQNNSPNADKLFLIKKSIRSLRSRLRWRLVEEGSLEEAEEQDLTEIVKKKEEIAETRNALFHEISQEKDEYKKLSVLAKGGFPELPLLYPEADILSYMTSEGLLVKSLDREVFDTEPMRELSGRRPLLCTEFQGQRVILKGYAIDEETEARMLEGATAYHRARMFTEEQAGLLPLVALFLGKSDPLAYVMVPYFTGGSLKVVQKSSPLTASETVGVMRGMALGLRTLHSSGITHGSLHPGNVFVLNREQGMVGDFDFTKTAEQRAVDSAMVAGSLSLVAPEVRQGQPPSQSSDMYCVGCLLLWLHFPDARYTLKTDGLIPDTSELKLDPKLNGLLSKLLVCSGRLTAPEVQSDDYFLEGGV
ncbi:serine/threonine kinase 31 isoform X2 [Conger conger]|uniref:serine/threonine kinase 31 isoform X2 n=1 Tax=Conger conger TaxID=82655 RepID=UPI002A5AFCE7|nr:serine/threonine kinase 31 isoform X2 [Conger conger]